MLISILIPGKNDNFRYNNTQTLEFNLNQTLDNIEYMNVDDVELVLCDWGSEEKIVDSVFKRKHKNFKCVYVNPQIAKKYNGRGNYSIVHPINTAFRYSSGNYVCFWDSDCFVLLDSFTRLYNFVKNMEKNKDYNFYWGSRFNIPYESYINLKTNKDLVEKIKNGIEYTHDKIGKGNEFMGTSIALLMNREIWDDSTGWYENLPYWGWQDIEFHRRLMTKYKFGGDLEDFKMQFFHLTQPVVHNKMKNNHLINPQISAPNFKANSTNWGLINENLEIIS
jgi:predicted glycosyltransferase involved in capsule biosynthesis